MGAHRVKSPPPPPPASDSTPAARDTLKRMACPPCGESPSGVSAALLGGTQLIDCTHTLDSSSFTFVGCFAGVENCKFKDTKGALYHPEEETPFEAARFGMAEIFCGRDKPEGYRKCIYRMACDVGTHIDSPAHWFHGMRDVSELTFNELTAAGAVIDLSEKCAADDYRLSVEDITDFEAAYGPLPARAFVVMKTG